MIESNRPDGGLTQAEIERSRSLIEASSRGGVSKTRVDQPRKVQLTEIKFPQSFKRVA